MVFAVELGRRATMERDWEFKMMDVSELFKQAMDVFLWEGCLRIIKCCEAKELSIVGKLIRYVLSRSLG